MGGPSVLAPSQLTSRIQIGGTNPCVRDASKMAANGWHRRKITHKQIWDTIKALCLMNFDGRVESSLSSDSTLKSSGRETLRNFGCSQKHSSPSQMQKMAGFSCHRQLKCHHLFVSLFAVGADGYWWHRQVQGADAAAQLGHGGELFCSFTYSFLLL